jgi:hypothetical protein
MKKLTILSAIAMSGLIYSTANAQIGIRVGLRLATPRVGVVVEQAPVYEQPAQVNYDGDDDYYYLPDVDAYYSVNEQCYYYFDGDSWISAAYLPGAYRDYDWRTARRYEVRAPRPYMHDDIYRSRYNGHAEGVFARGNDDRTQGGYSNNQERYNAPAQRFDNREQNYAPQNNGQRAENRGQGYSRPAQQDNGQRFDNRAQGGYRQPAQPNSNGQGSYRQSAQPNNGQNRGGNSRSAQQNQRGNGQPSNQNGGRDHGNSGGGQHYTQNSPKGGYSARSMTKF